MTNGKPVLCNIAQAIPNEHDSSKSLLKFDATVVVTSGSCADEDADECETVRANLEEIDTVFDEYGVVFVATHELNVAKENKVQQYSRFELLM